MIVEIMRPDHVLVQEDTNQSIIVWTLKTKSLLPPFTKGRRRRPERHYSLQAGHWDSGAGRNSPLWKRGVRGDFQKNMSNQLWTP